MTKINLSDGKYTVVNELGEGGGFKALRYGEEWRDLTGDNLVLAMYREIEELREQVAEVERLIEENEELRFEVGLYEDIIESRDEQLADMHDLLMEALDDDEN